jgi:GR25 family glycosyltransferase involved in LPS biosynthesis
VHCENTNAQQRELAETVLVISLPRRTDRRDRIATALRTENVSFEFVDGVRVEFENVLPEEYAELGWQGKEWITDRKGYIAGTSGCRRAHQLCLELAEARGAESLLILEDDAVFLADWLERYRAATSELPAGWWQMYLSGTPFNPVEKFSERLNRLHGAWQTTAILYSREGIRAALDCVKTAACEVDHWMALQLHPAGRSFMVNPPLTFHPAGDSDIRGK